MLSSQEVLRLEIASLPYNDEYEASRVLCEIIRANKNQPCLKKEQKRGVK